MQRGNGWDVDRVSLTCDLIHSRRASCSRQLLPVFSLIMSDTPLYGVSKFARISDTHFFALIPVCFPSPLVCLHSSAGVHSPAVTSLWRARLRDGSRGGMALSTNRPVPNASLAWERYWRWRGLDYVRTRRLCRVTGTAAGRGQQCRLNRGQMRYRSTATATRRPSLTSSPRRIASALTRRAWATDSAALGPPGVEGLSGTPAHRPRLSRLGPDCSCPFP